MAVNISLTARNSTCSLINSLIDVGSTKDSGYIEVRSGTIPSSPEASPSDGGVLATLMLSSPAFKEPVNGVATANAITPDTNIAASGKATWFRVYNRDGGAIIDGVVSAIGGGGDLTFDSVDFVKGSTAQVNSLTATMPR